MKPVSTAIPFVSPKALESSRVLAFMVLDELGTHLFDPKLPFYRR
jgi:hypothetical protein